MRVLDVVLELFRALSPIVASLRPDVNFGTRVDTVIIYVQLMTYFTRNSNNNSLGTSFEKENLRGKMK